MPAAMAWDEGATVSVWVARASPPSPLAPLPLGEGNFHPACPPQEEACRRMSPHHAALDYHALLSLTPFPLSL